MAVLVASPASNTGAAAGRAPILHGRISVIIGGGAFTDVSVVAAGATYTTVMLTSNLIRMNLAKGSPVTLSIDPEAIHLID